MYASAAPYSQTENMNYSLYFRHDKNNMMQNLRCILKDWSLRLEILLK